MKKRFDINDTIVGAARNITELKQGEGTIAHQNEFLKNILESLPHPFYVIDANDYTIKMANSAAAPGGLPPNVTCFELTHARDTPCETPQHCCPLETIKRTRKSLTIAHVHYDMEGNTKNVEIHAHPIFDIDGNVVQIVEYILDITERKRLEEDLRRAHDELQERTRALEESLASVKILRGLLPICAWCKKIRDDRGYWQQIEGYVRDHSEADFSHSICPACAQKAREEIQELISKSSVNPETQGL